MSFITPILITPSEICACAVPPMSAATAAASKVFFSPIACLPVGK